jgi:hypothetical protein
MTWKTKMALPLAMFFGILFLLSPSSPAAPMAHVAIKGFNPDGSLDKPTISKAYFEGEFWTVINALEAFRKSGMKTNREDSIYTFKYLSVVYAADASTRKKGESYMYQLIKMMPTIDLIDLYISDNIESIFKKVKLDYEELEKVRGTNAPSQTAKIQDTVKAKPAVVAEAPAQEYPVAPAVPAKEKEKKKPGMKAWVPFAIGGIGVGVATATYFLVTLGSDPASSSNTPRPLEITVVTPDQGSE